jgi:hypothetical protein
MVLARDQWSGWQLARTQLAEAIDAEARDVRPGHSSGAEQSGTEPR